MTRNPLQAMDTTAHTLYTAKNRSNRSIIPLGNTETLQRSLFNMINEHTLKLIPLELDAISDDEEKAEEEATLKKEMRLLEEEMGLVFTLQSKQSYSILLRRNRILIAAITVRFVDGGKVALRVALKTSCSKLARNRIEARLPVKQEKEVNCSDMRELICRCIWIVYHSF